MSSLPPGALLVLGALLVPLLRGRLLRLYLMVLPLLSALSLLHTEVGTHGAFELLGYQLSPVRVDSTSLVFGYVFHLALFVGNVFALHVKDRTQHVASQVYAGATIGAVFAGDLLTLFVYWEVVAIASVFLIWARRTPRAYRAGMRYLIWNILSGLLLLAGVLLYVRETGTLAFDALGAPDDPATLLIFLAFGIKCAWPGFHVWLSDAYPEATPTGTVFLSAFTTKLAVYALMRGFPGEESLIYIGAAMACFPIFYAVIENDLRRVLAYSLINQVGFMVVGIGIGTPLALDGACAHAFADVIFKGLLFMSMGAVLHRTGRINGSDLGGLYKTMPFTMACCIVGAASISAFPLFSAFATKSLIMSAAAEQHLQWVWLLLLFAAAGVFHHAGIKIPFFAFFAHDSGLRPKPAPWNMRVAMGVAALSCLALGTFPGQLLYPLLPHAGVGYEPYTTFHVVSQLQLLFFSALAFVTLMLTGLYPPELHSVNLDADWLYRRLLAGIWLRVLTPLRLIARGFQALVLDLIPGALAETFGREPRDHLLRSDMVLGSSALVVLAALVLFLLQGL